MPRDVVSKATFEDAAVLSFPPFRLDLAEERLWRGDDELRLRRKPFAILRHLALRPKRLVTHSEIVEAVWGRLAMSASLLRTHVRDLRQVLGNDVIQTVAGRGYRFGVDVQDARVPAAGDGQSDVDAAADASIVGRSSELAALHTSLRRTRDWRRQVVFVTGEAGVGKTALVDAFLAAACAQSPVRVARGSCLEHNGGAVAYFPIMEALGQLCRGRGAGRALELLIRLAPTWLAQMPSLVPIDQLEDLERRAAGATPARMLRELAEGLEALSAESTIVLVLDNLQWVDTSTADLLSVLGRRSEPARLFILGTYRPAEVPRGHLFTRATSELVAHRQASSLALEAFDEDTLHGYLAKRFGGNAFPPAFATTVHELTGGNPLFVAALLDDLEKAGHLRKTREGWALTVDVEQVAGHRPESVRRLIDARIDWLSPTEQRIVEVASVAGLTFQAGVVAHALDLPVDDVDSCCETLAEGQGLLRFVKRTAWPDGTVQSTYAFTHALFWHAALARNTSGSNRHWHRRIAEKRGDGP